MANALEGILLSGSTNGRGIKIAATSTTGTTVHTAVSGTTHFDAIYLWATNSSSSDLLLTVEFGGVSSPDDLIHQTIYGQKGLQLVTGGQKLNNGCVVRAFAASANLIMIHGYAVRRSTAS